MRLKIISAFLFLAAAPQLHAIVTLGQSTQNFGLTGIGGNSQGEGQSVMSWGSCAFDGTNTNCTLSGSYTNSSATATLGASGTYSFVITYAGKGTFPLNAVSTTPGGNMFTASATSNFSLVITLTPANLPAVNFYSFYNFNFVFIASLDTCTGVSAASCNVGQVGLTPGATIVGPITGSFDPTPVISNNGVISASNYGNGFPAIAPSTWIEIYGFNLATVPTQTWAGSNFVGTQAPSALGGTTATVAGQPAYVYFVTPGQVDVQVPSGIAAGLQPLVLTTAGGSSLPYMVTVNTVEPGVLAPPAFNISGKQNVVALESNTLTYVLPTSVAGVSTTQARVGDSLTLYGIGFGTVTPNIPAGQVVQTLSQLTSSLQITFGGVPCTITYQGLAPNYVGLYQFNVTVPNIPANTATPVVFTVNGVAVPQTLYIAIAN
jgi:uncharacterized protein (TIGR03437 family)